jgi:hypothetical protein
MLAESATQASEASNMPQWLAHIFQLLEDDGVAGGLLPAEVDNLLDSFFSCAMARCRYLLLLKNAPVSIIRDSASSTSAASAVRPRSCAPR